MSGGRIILATKVGFLKSLLKYETDTARPEYADPKTILW